MPTFKFTDDFCDRVEKIVGRKFTRGGQKMMNDCINVLEAQIKEASQDEYKE